MRKRLSQFVVPVGVVLIIVMMVVPLPTFLLDLLIALNITGALLILLVSMYVKRPLDFSSSRRCCWSPRCSGSR